MNIINRHNIHTRYAKDSKYIFDYFEKFMKHIWYIVAAYYSTMAYCLRTIGLHKTQDSSPHKEPF